MDYADYIKPSLLNRQKRRDKRLYEELIECRRSGGGDKNKKLRDKGQNKKLQQARQKDSLPMREAYCPKLKRAFPNDNLEPLIRFLESHKGQLWDKVYSKLNKQLDKRSTVGMHVLDHLWHFVALNTEIDENGHVRIYSLYGRLPRFEHRWFYVHPKTGILCSKRYKEQKGPFPKKARWKKEKQKNKWKKRLGILPKLPKKQINSIYELPNFCTTNQEIKMKQEYDFIKGKFIARIKIMDDKSQKYQGGIIAIYMKAKVLESDFSWMTGSIIRLQAHSYHKDAEPVWKIFNKGRFNF